jgi:type VI secretion system protein ImpL
VLQAAGQAGISAGPAGVDAGRAITDYFNPIHEFVGDGKVQAPVDEFIGKLKAAIIAKNAADMAGGMGSADVAQAELNRTMSELGAAAVVAPPMIQGFVGPAAKAGGEARVSSAQGAVSSMYAQTIGPACASVTEGRYPFMTASQNNAPVGDLLRVFGLNGQVDSFVNQRLRPLMETTGPIWRWRLDDPVAASLDPTSAGEFQRAAELRELLLSGVVVKVEATGFGGTVTAAEMSAGGANYRFEAGQPGQRQIQWTPSSLPEARVALFAGTTLLKEYPFDGPWATFRMFDAARKENAGPTAFKATFGEGASTVTFRVSLPSEKNPFSRGGIWSFRCPPRL